MNRIGNLHWPLVLGLGALGLIRPLVNVVEHQLGTTASATVPIIITAAISVIWIATVGLREVAEPVLTLLFAALTYAVLSSILSGILSPILTGELQGPFAAPFTIIPILLTNAVWGLAAGGLALLLQRARGVRVHAGRRS